MFAAFDNTTLAFFGIALAVGTYFLGATTDNVMGADGFGAFKNTIILIIGSFLGLFAIEHMQLPIHNVALRTLVCAVGAFSALALLAMLKAFARRLHY